MKRFILCILICFGWYGSFQTVQADPLVELNYTFTTINVPGSTSTSAYGINNAGQIVGAYTDNTGTHGFLDTNGTFTTLPFVATGINNIGQTVGLSSNGLILDTNGVITNIALTALPGFISLPYIFSDRVPKINDLGQIVGNYNDNYYGIRGFIYTSGTFALLPGADPNLNEESITAHGINNAGQTLVTIVYTAHNATYLYQNGQYTTPIFTDQTGAAIGVDGVALNNVGQALGYYPVSTYLYTNGVVGYIHLPQPNEPFDINDAGVIVGGDIIATPVPEPSSLLLFAGGLAALDLLRRARR